MVERTEGPIKNGQSRNTVNIEQNSNKQINKQTNKKPTNTKSNMDHTKTFMQNRIPGIW